MIGPWPSRQMIRPSSIVLTHVAKKRPSAAFSGELVANNQRVLGWGALGICFFGKNQTGIVASSNVGLYESAMLKSPSVHNLASDPGRRQYFRNEELGLFGALVSVAYGRRAVACYSVVDASVSIAAAQSPTGPCSSLGANTAGLHQ